MKTWQTLSTREIYENPWISLREDQIIAPSGHKGIYGVVTFKNKAIGIVALDKHQNVYLVGQQRYPIQEYSWEIPEGGGPMNESPLETAKRELKEETGLIASQWTQIVRIHTSNSVCNEEGFVFLAEDLSLGETSFDETEVLEQKKIPLKDALKLVMEMKITDSLTIAGIFATARLKGI